MSLLHPLNTASAAQVTPAGEAPDSPPIFSTLGKRMEKEPADVGAEKNDDIDRLVSVSTPCLGEAVDLPAMDAEISSFYISPLSTTNHSLIESLSQEKRSGDFAETVASQVQQSLITHIRTVTSANFVSSVTPSTSTPTTMAAAADSAAVSTADSISTAALPSDPSSPPSNAFAGIADEEFREFIVHTEDLGTPPAMTSLDSTPPATDRACSGRSAKWSKGSRRQKRAAAEDALEKEEPLDLESILVSEEQENAERRSARKRKTVVTFDPTPTKMRAVRNRNSPKAVDLETETSASVSTLSPKIDTTVQQTPVPEVEELGTQNEEPIISEEKSSAKKSAQKKKIKEIVEDPNLLEKLAAAAGATPDMPIDLFQRAHKWADRAEGLLEELLQLEKCPDGNDHMLEVDRIAEVLVNLCQEVDADHHPSRILRNLPLSRMVVDHDCKSISVATTATSATTASSLSSLSQSNFAHPSLSTTTPGEVKEVEKEGGAPEMPTEHLSSTPSEPSSTQDKVPLVFTDLMHCLIARLAHGSSKNLPSLSESIVSYLRDHLYAPLLACSSSPHVAFYRHELESNYLQDSQVGELVKTLCSRVAHGYKQNVFYTTNNYSYTLWRWECGSPSQLAALFYFDYWLLANIYQHLALRLDSDGVTKVDFNHSVIWSTPLTDEDRQAAYLSLSSSNQETSSLPASEAHEGEAGDEKDHSSENAKECGLDYLNTVKALQAIVKEAKSNRSLYGRAVASLLKMIDILFEMGPSLLSTNGTIEGEDHAMKLLRLANKLAPHEEALGKRMQDIDKAKEKKREMEKKRLAKLEQEMLKKEAKQKAQLQKEQREMELKALKEAQREAREREKELKEREKEAREREKEEKAKEQKEKEQSKLAKQANLLKSFFGAPKKVSGSSSSTAAAMNPSASAAAEERGTTTGEDDEGRMAGMGASSVGEGEEACLSPVSSKMRKAQREEALRREFIELIKRGDFDTQTACRRKGTGRKDPPPSSSSSLAESRETLSGGKRGPSEGEKKHLRFSRRRKERKIRLPVPVAMTKPVHPTQASSEMNLIAEQRTFTEIQWKTFLNRQVLFSFHEDHRPAYSGTFQKRSALISGRRPFAKDTSVLNYDYDSEASYLSEDVSDAESIASDQRSEEGEDKLEYDGKFFVLDNVLENGEGGEENMDYSFAANNEERVGIYFIRNFAPLTAGQGGATVFGSDTAQGYRLDFQGAHALERCGAEEEDEVNKLACYGAVMYI